MYDPHARNLARVAATNSFLSREPRIRALALGLSAALAVPLAIQQAAASHAPASGLSQYIEMSKAPVHPLGQTRTVKNCSDSATDSLRDIIMNPNSPNHAQTGDTVDLSQLPTLCGMAQSVITLGSEIVVDQDDLTLQGPTKGTVTISAARTSRVFHHHGTGTFALTALTVSDGYYHIATHAYGGCIESDNGNVFLLHTTVSDCAAVSDDMNANGGGIEAFVGDVTLLASRVSGNQTKGGAWGGWGGGIYSHGATTAFYSTISGNVAHDEANSASEGGGVATRGGLALFASTIAHNTAGYGGGLAIFGSTMILNSTVSNNTATSRGGGVRIVNPTALLANSTIAFNHQSSVSTAATSAGVYFFGDYGGSLELQSSVIADNSAGVGNVPSDVYIPPGNGSLVGADNLVIAANVFNPVAITVTADPKLGPLQFNGGRTQTHRLLPGSPALGKGNVNGLAPPWNTTDQRGIGYPRTSGANASVDLGAVQFDSIFADNFDVFY